MSEEASPRQGYNLRKRKVAEIEDNSADEDYPPKKTRTPRKPKTPKKEFSDDSESTLKIGDLAPTFEDIEDQDGVKHSLTSLLSQEWVQKLVLFFYPKDSSEKSEAPAFGTLYEEYKKNGIEVVGVSVDTVKAHKAMVSKLSLPYKLLSDHELTIIGKFDLKNKNGKAARRGSFVIGKDGKIERVYLKVKTATHPQDVLDEITGKSVAPTEAENGTSQESQEASQSSATSQDTQESAVSQDSNVTSQQQEEDQKQEQTQQPQPDPTEPAAQEAQQSEPQQEQPEQPQEQQ